jgi:hypothetical protein
MGSTKFSDNFIVIQSDEAGFSTNGEWIEDTRSIHDRMSPWPGSMQEKRP